MKLLPLRLSENAMGSVLATLGMRIAMRQRH